MAKGTIQVDVQANTSKAASSIKKLKSDLENNSTFKSLGNSIMGPLSGGGVGSLLKLGSGLLAGGAVISEITSEISRAVNAGAEAQKQFEDLNTSLTTLARNAGSTRTDFRGFIDDVQKMAANGVNSFESLSSASKTLYTAFNGNTNEVKKMLGLFDDLAAGTGVQVDDWASMASEVIHTGVSIKDLTKLSNKGIPIYQALGSAMGVTADEAEKMAKAGQVGTQDWMKAVEELANRYKGLSQELSSNTLEGAKSTLEQSLGIANRAYSEGYNKERISGMNKQSKQLQEEARNPILNALKEDTGKMAATLSNFWAGFEGWIVKGASGLDAFIRDWTPFGKSTEELYNESNTRKANDIVAQYNKAVKEGNWSSGDIKALRTDLLTSGIDWNKAGYSDGKIQEVVNNLTRMFEDAAQKEKEAAEAAAARAKEEQKQENIHNAQLKHGDLATKIKALSGQGYIPELSGPESLEGAIKSITDQLLAGTIENVKLAEDNITQLTDINKEYIAKEKELADAKNQAIKASVHEVEAAEQKKKAAENNVAKAKEKLEDAEIASMKRQVELRKNGIFSGNDLKGMTSKMNNYNDWMALYDQAAAEGVSRAEWRRKFGKVKKMSATELEGSGLFKQDMDVSDVGPNVDRARDELDKAQQEAKDAYKELAEATGRMGKLADELGTTNEGLKDLSKTQDDWMKKWESMRQGNALRTAGTALAS